MRILQLTAFYLPSIGGIQLYVRNLSRALTGRGHTVDILTVNTEGVNAVEVTPAGTVYRCALDFSYHRGLISRELIGRLLQARGYDAVHIHIPFPLGLEAAAVGALRNRTPLVVTHHGTGAKNDRLYTLIAGLYDKVYRGVSLRLATRIIFLTESYRAEVPLAAGTCARTQIVRTGADTTTFNPLVDGSIVRNHYGLAQDEVVALWVGSLNEHNRYKGLNYLLDALARNEAAEIRLLLVGDGALRAELQEQAKRLSLGRRAIFVGAVENSALPAYYAAADCFVLPSIHGPENSPVVVFEAMASGLPVVASDIAGVREIVEHGCTGLLLPPRDTAQLAATLGGLAAERNLRERLGHQARAKALMQSWEQVAIQMEQIYGEAAGSQGRSSQQAELPL